MGSGFETKLSVGFGDEGWDQFRDWGSVGSGFRNGVSVMFWDWVGFWDKDLGGWVQGMDRVSKSGLWIGVIVEFREQGLGSGFRNIGIKV